MGKLEDYYEFVANLGLDKKNSEKQQEVLKKMEEDIIREEIFPLLSRALAQPISRVKRALSLTIDYTPGQGLKINMTDPIEANQESKTDNIPIDDPENASIVADDSDPFEDIKSLPGYSGILMEKEVDWSVLNHGFTIPMMYHDAFKHQYANSVERGHGAEVTVILQGVEYPATLREPDMSGGRKVLQMLWKGKGLVTTLREIFADTYAFMCTVKEQGNGKKQIKLPESLQRKIIICSHEQKGFYIIIPDKNKR